MDWDSNLVISLKKAKGNCNNLECHFKYKLQLDLGRTGETGVGFCYFGISYLVIRDGLTFLFSTY